MDCKNIWKEAWANVADIDGGKIISKAIVCDLLDPQHNVYAQKIFSLEVEEAMLSLGHNAEAEFCRLIREWYDAEDQPGIPALERAKMRLAFRA